MLTVFLSLAAAEEATPTRTYALEADRSRLYVLVKYDRKALVAGHDHVVAASRFTGQVTWNEADPSVCDVSIAFPVTALVVDPGNARSWEGLGGETSAGDKETITENLRGKHQLEASLFPEVRFQSKRCTRSGSRIDVAGDLTIHGVSAPVTASMAITTEGSELAARGRFTADHGTWGMKPFSVLLGSVRNDEALTFVVDVKGRAR